MSQTNRFKENLQKTPDPSSYQPQTTQGLIQEMNLMARKPNKPTAVANSPPPIPFNNRSPRFQDKDPASFIPKEKSQIPGPGHYENTVKNPKKMSKFGKDDRDNHSVFK